MDLHGQMMNISVDEDRLLSARGNGEDVIYKMGHRDARHAAAEVSLKAGKCIEALRAIVASRSLGEEELTRATKALSDFDGHPFTIAND